MIRTDYIGIDRQIKALNDLQESILLDVVWKDYGTTIELHFNSVLRSQNDVGTDVEKEKLVVLRFYSVQELLVRNFLNDSMLIDPSQLNWGLSEISMVKLERNSKALAYYESPIIPLNHVVILWEGERKIDIIFSGLEVDLPLHH